MKVYVGYDEREDPAYRVCEWSIQRFGHNEVEPLNHRDLRRRGYLTRPWQVKADGEYRDILDGRPFSTQFAHSRFLVPALARDRGEGPWVAFCDCDFLWLEDPSTLMAHADDRYAAMVVKREWDQPDGTKMDGVSQKGYPRKLWSSMVLWNVNHHANEALTVEAVNSLPGSSLHRFSWLDDEQIGALPSAFNFVPEIDRLDGSPAAVHYSTQAPWFGQKDGPYAGEWMLSWRSYLREAARGYRTAGLHV